MESTVYTIVIVMKIFFWLFICCFCCARTRKNRSDSSRRAELPVTNVISLPEAYTLPRVQIVQAQPRENFEKDEPPKYEELDVSKLPSYEVLYGNSSRF